MVWMSDAHVVNAASLEVSFQEGGDKCFQYRHDCKSISWPIEMVKLNGGIDKYIPKN